MESLHTKIIYAFGLGAVLTCSLRAEQLDSLRHGDPLDEITITATKRSILKKEFSSSVSVLNARELEQNQFQGIKDLNAHIPNVYIPDFGSALSTPIFIRGIGSRRINMIGIYSDGIPLLEGASIDADYGDVRSVEFLRGPQGTLFGRGAMGGIINLRSYRPLDYQGTHIKLLAGEYGLAGIQAQSYQNLSEYWGIGASISARHREGYYVNQYNKQTVDKMNNLASKFALQYRHKGWEVYAFAQYQKRDQGGYPYAPANPDGSLAPINYNYPSSYERQLFTSGLNVQKVWADNWMFKSSSAYQSLADEMIIDQDFSPKPDLQASLKSSKNIFTQELNISGKNKRYSWVTGVYAYLIDGHRSIINDYNMPQRKNVSQVRINFDEPSYGLAAYHQSNYKITERLSAELGLRYDWERGRQDYDMTRIDLLNKDNKTHQRRPAKSLDKQFTPKFSLNYRFGKQQHVYASVLRGYQSSGFNMQFDKPEEQVYKPEYSWNYELGTHLNLLHNSLSIDAALFYIDWQQQQVTQAILNGLGTKITNAGKSRSMGLELALAYRPMNNLNLAASYGYTHASYQVYEELSRQGKTSHAGKFIPQVPRQTIAGRIDYSDNIGHAWLQTLNFGLQYRGLGEIFWDNDNLYKQNFYHLMDVQIVLGFGKTSLELWGRNLNNSQYLAYLTSSRGRQLGQKGLPRHFGVSLRMKF